MTTASQTVPAGQSRKVVVTPVQGPSTGTRLLSIAKYALLIFLAFTWLFPLYWMALTAIKNDSQIRTVPPIHFPSPIYWSNFASGWARYNFNLAAFNSIFRYSLPVVLLTLISSLVVAYGFAKIRWRGRSFFFGLCIATMMLPWQVTMVPLFIIFKQYFFYCNYSIFNRWNYIFENFSVF